MTRTRENGIVHLWNLPENRVCLRLPDHIQRTMIEQCLKICPTLRSLSKQLGINAGVLSDFKNSRFGSTTLKDVANLSKYLAGRGFVQYSMARLEEKVKIIKAMRASNAVRNPKFPMDFTCKRGAQTISAILFDGGISSQLLPFYMNNEEFLIRRLLENVRRVVGDIDYHVRAHSQHPETLILNFPKILGYILVNGLGMVPGRKVLSGPPIPAFIMRAKKDVQREFLQQALDDEGAVSFGSSGSGRSINIFQYNAREKPPARLLQLKELIEGFGVPVNGPYGPTYEHRAKRGYTSYGWVIQITNQPDIRAFAERIGFSLARKRRALEELLNSYVLPPRFKKGTIEAEILKICRKLKLEGRKITINKVARELGRGESWVAEVMRNMVKEGKLRILEQKASAKTYRGGFTRKRFDVGICGQNPELR